MQNNDENDKIKNHILKSAIEEYQKHGVSETTVKQIAKTGGVGKGTIYKYFNSKEEIIIKASDYYNNKLKEDLIYLIEFAQNDPVQAMDSYIEKTIQATIHNPQELLFRTQLVSEAVFLNQESQDNINKKYKELTEPMLEVYEKIINVGIEKDIIKPKIKNKELPIIIDSLIRGISLMAFLKDDEEIYRIGMSIKRTIFDLLGLNI
jgi:AcrR family transcriptional regulator